MSVTSSIDVANAQARRRRGTQRDTVEKRALRAFHMVQLGEVSAGRQALEGASLATGDERTLKALKDPARRPALPRNPMPEIAQFIPGEPFALDQELFAINVRTARKGAAPGPSSMTADHLRPLVEHASLSAVFGQAAALLALNKVPEEVMDALRCGRLIALKKPDGGVRGIVVGDVMRRVVARTIANRLLTGWRRQLRPTSTHSRRKRVARPLHTSCRP